MLVVLVAGSGFANGDQEGSSGRGNPVAVSIYLPGSPQDDKEQVESVLAEYTTAKINAYPDVQFIGWGEWWQKKQLMIASGEEFDIGFTAIWNNFEDEVARNAWEPLNDLIDNEAPALRKVVGDFLKGPTIDGKIYAISTVKEKADSSQFLLNEEYVTKYNIPYDELKTIDDIEPWLAKIRAGEEREIAPWFMDGGNTALQKIVMGDWESVMPDFYLDPNDGKIKHQYHIEEMWDSLEASHRWYNAGYFQENLEDIILSNTSSEELKKGNWVFYIHVSHPGKAGEMTGSNGFPIVAGGPIQQPVIMQGMLLGSMMAISRTSPHKVEAIKMLELMNTDKYVNNTINFGLEGEHFEFVDKDKIIRTIDDSGYAPNMTWALQNQFSNYLRDFEPADKWDRYQAFNDSARLGEAVGFFPNVKPIKNQIATLQNALEEYTGILKSGILNPRDVRDEVVAKIEAAGVLEIEAELQRQFDSWKAKM